jgi:glutathione S-transferase
LISVLALYDHAASCNCYKVRLLLAQLGLAYQRIPVDIFAGETLTAEFDAINPARATPVLAVDGHHLAESGAILSFLAEGTELAGRDRLERAEILRWLLYEQADIVPAIGGLRFRLLTGRLEPTDPDAVRRRASAHEVLALLDGHLAGREFLVAGRYTIADIAVYGYVHRSPEAGIDLAPHAALGDWLDRISTRERYFEDVEPYGANARPGRGRSIYD